MPVDFWTTNNQHRYVHVGTSSRAMTMYVKYRSRHSFRFKLPLFFRSFQHPHQPAVQRVPRHADVVRPVASSRAPSAGTDHPVGDRRGRVLADGARPERDAVRPGRPYAVQLQRISEVISRQYLRSPIVRTR